MGKNKKTSQKCHVRNDQKHSFHRLPFGNNIHRDRSNCEQSTSYLDDLEPLTPNLLLLGRYIKGAVIEENDGDISTSHRRWKQVVAI